MGTTDYPVPANALFVSPTGSDSAAGTVSAPLQTIAAAITKAATGQTIVLRAGTYNESVTIPANEALTIQSYPDEAVWLDGSIPVTTWAQTGDTWTTSNWNFFPSNSLDGIADNPRYVDPAYPMAARPDQVFYNGAQLTQVASAADVTAGTFYPDPSTKTVVIGSDPTGQQVRISNLGRAVYVKSSGSTLRGFGVRRYATDQSLTAAVLFENTNATAQNLDIEDNALGGISADNNNTLLDHLTVERSGFLGIGDAYAYGLTISNSVVDDNNSQFFKNAPVSGGIKVTRTRGVTIENNEIDGNHSAGFWCDESCYNINVIGNTTDNNRSTGIQLEISELGVIADNESDGNATGINIIDTGHVRVLNNDVTGNTSFGIETKQDSRLITDPTVPGHDPRQPNPDPTMPWQLSTITLENNIVAEPTGYQIYAWNAAATGFTITGNLLSPHLTVASSTLLAWVGAGTTDFTKDQTAAAIDALGTGWTNTATTASETQQQMTADAAAAASTAAPLPADIAALTGQPAGSQHIGTF